LAEEELIHLKDAVRVLNKFNNNIKPFGAQVCFAHTVPPLLVHIQEDGATCLQGDIDQDFISNLAEDINGNGDVTDDDIDKDGIPNYLDTDDNNDGVLTIEHDLNNNGDPTDDDTDGDGIPDYIEEVEVAINTYHIERSIYPNPNNGVFEVSGIYKTDDEVSIYSIDGKPINFKIIEKMVWLNKPETGIYLLKIGKQIKKIIVQ